MDMEKDIMVMYQEENGKKTATALPSMMSLGAAMAKSQMDNEEMTGSIKETGKTKKVAGYLCKEFEFKDGKEMALTYVTNDLDFSWPQAFGKMLEKYMPENNSIPAEAFNGMALESITYDKKGKEDTHWVTNKVSLDQLMINNSEYEFNDYSSSEAEK
jgi:hypothetical protein